MQYWNVFDWADGTTVRVVATAGFVPIRAIGPAIMVPEAPVPTPVPEEALLTQTVNGVATALADPVKLQSLFPDLLKGLKLF